MTWIAWVLCAATSGVAGGTALPPGMPPAVTAQPAETPDALLIELGSPGGDKGDELIIPGHVGLDDFRASFSLTVSQKETVRFSQPVLTKTVTPDGSSHTTPTAHVRVGEERTLLPGVRELFELKVSDVTEAGDYIGTLVITRSQGKPPHSISLRVKAEGPKGVSLGSPAEFQGTRCSACWLRDMLSLGEDSQGPQKILVNFNDKDLIRYTEHLKVELGSKGKIGPENAGTPTLAALGWPQLRRQGDQVYLFFQLDPNALSPGTHPGLLYILLPNGSMLQQDKPVELTVYIRQGPGVLLGLVLAGALLYLVGRAFFAPTSRLERLKEEVKSFLGTIQSKDEAIQSDSMRTDSVRTSYKQDVARLQGRLGLLEGSMKHHLPSHSRRILLLLYRLAQTLRYLRQLEDSLSRSENLYPAEQRELAINSIQNTCLTLRDETEPALVSRSLDILRRNVTYLEEEAIRDDKARRSTGLAFIISQLQVLEKAARSPGSQPPVPWLSIGLADVFLFVALLASSLVVSFFIYAYDRTFGSSPWPYVLIPVLTIYLLCFPDLMRWCEKKEVRNG
jgi:hypothetical protein